jgi:2-hydroxy-3-oxopropionate reductase
LLGALAAQLLGAVVARGDGALDHSAMYKLVTELSGR